MKKTYINPTLEVVKVATQQMLAASNQTMTITNSQVDSGTAGDAHDDDFDW